MAIIIGVLDLEAGKPQFKNYTSAVPKLIQTDLFLYASGGSTSNAKDLTAISVNSLGSAEVYNSFLDIGAQGEWYFDKSKSLRLCGSLGYKCNAYSFDRIPFNSSSVYSSWLSPELKLEFSYLGAGIKSDVFLGSRIRNNDDFLFEGIYPSCFNKCSFCWFGQYHIRLTNFKIELKVGAYIVPQLNLMNIVYYNMTNPSVDPFFLEIRLFYRIFTSGKVHNAPTLIGI